MLVLVGLTVSSPSTAAPMTVTPEMRQAAMQVCTGDVFRLCASSVFDEQKVFACMGANRAQLSPSCRAVFDQGAKTLKR